MSGISRKAKKIRRVHSSRGAKVQGWWYENAKSIDVYLRDDEGKHSITARINRAELAAWLQRSESPVKNSSEGK